MANSPRYPADAPRRQLDLFAASGVSAPASDGETFDWAPLDPERLSDSELIAVLPRARQVEAPPLVREVVRRKLQGAVPALELLCRRFAGFGMDREVTEQMAAFSGLAALGGEAAKDAAGRLIVAGAVRGPGLRVALETASKLGCRLPPGLVVTFLRDDDPKIREAACRCARGGTEAIASLVELLADLHESVMQSAALALGRLGRRDAAPVLTRMLATAPSEAIVRALAAIADEDDWVRLGQTALKVPDLAPVVLEVLEDSEEPRAAAIAAGVRRRFSAARE